MLDETKLEVAIAPKSDNDRCQLSSQERVLIRNFRAMKSGAQDMLCDLSEQYRRTLPATPVDLRLLRSGE
jgi:hypothetical protein